MQLINADINSLEPLVDGFLKESDALLRITREMELVLRERVGITRRGYIAKEIAANLNAEISNKLYMFHKIKKEKRSYSYAMNNIFRFMSSRLLEMQTNLERSQANIDIAIE